MAHKITSLRDYQSDLKSEIFNAWKRPGVDNTLAVLPTGGGKTVVLSHVVQEYDAPTCVIAHRRELVKQISLALGANGIRHRIIAPNDVIKMIVRAHVAKLGASYYDPGAVVGAASVDTLQARMKKAGPGDLRWFNSIRLWVQDEAHHVLAANKWGKVTALFPKAEGLGVTASPCRADKKGLGADSDGVFHKMVMGPSMRDLINEGYLSDYRIICSPIHLGLTENDITASGEFSQKKAAEAIEKAQVIGDIVKNYQKFVNGKRAVTFLPSVEAAIEQAARLNAAGVPAQALSAKSKDYLREQSIDRLETGALLNLVNVALFGEGFDLPAIDCAQFGAPTASFGKFLQEFGRPLRPVYAEGYDLGTRAGRLAAIANGPKPKATIIDHVGNVIRHNGPPDTPRDFSLDNGKTKKKAVVNSIPLRVCINELCLFPYPASKNACPFCDTPKPEPQSRSLPEQVDGDLYELDEAALRQLRGEAIDVDRSPEQIRDDVINSFTPAIGQEKTIAARIDRQVAQKNLRYAIDWWAGWRKANGVNCPRERQKEFFFNFGVDVLSAKALKTKDAKALQDRIYTAMGVNDESMHA